MRQKTVSGLTPKKIARKIANLNYNELVDFLKALGQCFVDDADNELQDGEEKLAELLYEAATDIDYTIDKMKEIAKFYKKMKRE